MNSRTVAYDILLKIERDKAYSNLTLDKELSESNLNSLDKALASRIVYGVLERKITLDYALNQYIKTGLKKLKPNVRTILRMGAYQILFMDKIPPSAVVNESVKITKKKAQYASGMVNGVLRNLIRSGFDLPDENDKILYNSIKYSCPEWLVKLWLDYLGEEDVVKFLEYSLLPPPMYIRVNTIKTTADNLIELFAEKGITAEKTDIEDSLLLHGVSEISHLKEYRNGYFYVQDLSSQICAKSLEAESGETVFDMCCAPGGKTFTIAQTMKNKGEIKAFDIYDSRLKLVDQSAKRLGIEIIEVKNQDASKYYPELGLADRILCDVPCSGLGIIRRKPEIKYKDKEELDSLPEIQYSILTNASKYLKPSGTMIYSTCTLNPSENEEVCDRFLSENPGFSKDCEYRRLLPQNDLSDGFFIAKFRKGEQIED